jgi:argininosuccinate synthase
VRSEAKPVAKAGKRRELKPMNPTMAADLARACNQDDATGFIRLSGLRLKVVAKVHGKK